MDNKPTTAEEFARLANNFYMANGQASDYNRIISDSHLINYILTEKSKLKKYKVAFLWICLNPQYWEYAKDMMEGARKFFLPGHQTDFFLWSDMPPENNYGATVFPTEPVEWPLPTLMRYSLFLQQEEKLKEYDYLFYCDVDMKFVGIVGDEILGEGLTAAQHPMYAIRKEFIAPTEPNPKSTAYMDLPKYYFAGGFQGGKTADFIKAMKVMKKNIDVDFTKNYMARWNDESHWNKYLHDNPPYIVLSPSYIYPDSLIKEYYEKLWGCSYVPKLVTLTKKFSTSAEGGAAVTKMINTL
jgi:hypothetical protein